METIKNTINEKSGSRAWDSLRKEEMDLINVFKLNKSHIGAETSLLTFKASLTPKYFNNLASVI